MNFIQLFTVVFLPLVPTWPKKLDIRDFKMAFSVSGKFFKHIFYMEQKVIIERVITDFAVERVFAVLQSVL